jgi:hypothetical protein
VTSPKTILSTRVRTILRRVVAWNGVYDPGDPALYHVDHYDLSDIELLRRAAKIKPDLSFRRLALVRGCGQTTAREICLAMGLPEKEVPLERVQCPRCYHVFGGSQ